MPNISTASARLAGQRLMIGFNGSELTETLKHFIGNFELGGVILFKRNLESPEQVRTLCKAIQAYADDCGLPPLFIGIDQEGGTVARLPEPFTRFPGQSHLTSEAEADAFGTTTARELRTVGINMNMAPVLDVISRQQPGVMKDRSFGFDPHWVGMMGGRVIDALQTDGIMAVAKHFPGIGRTTLDSHVDMPTLDINRHDLLGVDILPFSVAFDRQVAGVMLSHIRYAGIDAAWPASLSTVIARDLLRRTLGYNGLVLTDDLDMGAIVKHFDIQTVIERILLADIDIALICHEGPNIETAFDTMVHQIESSADLKSRSIDSLKRIMALKSRYLGVKNGA